MSKSKKEEKGKKDLSIPPIPNPIFLVELDEYILLTGFPIQECVFPCYLFDNDCEGAFNAAYEIGKNEHKLIIDSVNYYSYDPHVYDPIMMDLQIQNILNTVGIMQASMREAWEKSNKNKESGQT